MDQQYNSIVILAYSAMRSMAVQDFEIDSSVKEVGEKKKKIEYRVESLIQSF